MFLLDKACQAPIHATPTFSEGNGIWLISVVVENYTQIQTQPDFTFPHSFWHQMSEGK